MRIFSALILCCLCMTTNAQEHGFVDENSAGKLQVWNADQNKWTNVESFWQHFAKTNNAKSWGRSDTYPNFIEVNEFDTLLVEVKQGKCLMQFFHSRWRRANDVQRWHDSFNEYGGCPNVFD